MSTKLPVISGEHLIKILVKKGFTARRQSGSHAVMQKEAPRYFLWVDQEVLEKSLGFQVEF